MKSKFLLTGAFLIIAPAFLKAQDSVEPGFRIDVGLENLVPILKTKTIELPGNVKLEYVEQGKENGIPVIFLHRITDSWRSFELALPHLNTGIHAFAITQRGHGNSFRPESGYRTTDLAGDIVAFINKLKLGPVILVGHSMGATVSQHMAVNHPELIRGLVLLGSFARFHDKPELMEFRKTISELKDPIDRKFAEDFQKATIAKPMSDDQLNIFVDESMKLPASVWKALSADWDNVDYMEGLKNFDKPTLLIWGEKDLFVPRADQASLIATIKNSSLIVYQGVGHAVHWDAPKRFAEDLSAFIRNIQN